MTEAKLGTGQEGGRRLNRRDALKLLLVGGVALACAPSAVQALFPTETPTPTEPPKPSNNPKETGTSTPEKGSTPTTESTSTETATAKPPATETPTPTEAAPVQDLAAVIALVEKDLHPYNADGGGVVILEAKAIISLKDLNTNGQGHIPDKLGGGEVVWDIAIPVGQKFIYAVMAKKMPNGRFVAMNMSGSLADPAAFTEHLNKAQVFGDLDQKTCQAVIDIGTTPRNPATANTWELSLQVQPDWRDMLFLSEDGKKVQFLGSVQCH